MNRKLLPLIHLPLFLVGGLVWLLFLGVMVAVLLLADAGATPGVPPEELLSPTALGAMTILQTFGLAAWALVLSAGVAEEPPWISMRLERFRLALAAQAPSVGMVLTALVGGLVVWTLPSWFAEQLGQLFPNHTGTLDLVNRALTTADPLGRAMMIGAVGVSAPLFEEVIFRGYVWRVLEVALGPLAAMVGSTLLFAAFHIDPVHVVSLLPTAVFLGFLRWRSGSLLPCVLAHAVNNGLGVAAALLFPDADPTATLPLWAAFGGFAATLLVAGAGHRFSGRAPASVRA
ncbi:MAG: CPBP family intramembrane metalloprotease [Alphaproteobacteria bacterium]|nr:CPBP family intramembrane metalloprotease [Alphaproteobacteria bacterium]MCB9698191.1 CPBP family intramembrane metalloprotease [Alphaproteobacteria bacterium]